MAGINLPDLVQKVKVDTSSMALAARRATAMGVKFKQAERQITQSQKNMDRALTTSNKVMRSHHEQQTKLIRSYTVLSKGAKDNARDMEASSRGIKSSDRALKELARTTTRANQNLKSVARSMASLAESSTSASTGIEGIGSGMTRASRRTKQFKRDADAAGKAVKDIPDSKDVEFNAEAKNTKKTDAALDAVARRRQAMIEAHIEDEAKAETKLDVLARDRKAKIKAEVVPRNIRDVESVFTNLTKRITNTFNGGRNRRGGSGGIGFLGAGLFTGMIKEAGKLALSLPIRAFQAFGSAVDVFQESFEVATKSVAAGGKGMGKIAGFASAGSRAFSALGASAASGVAAVALLIPAAVAVSAAFGAVASAISLMGGMLTAFVGTIGTAIVAPLLAAVPLVGAFGVGALVAGGAVMTWAKNSKALEEAVKPIKRELKSLAKEMTPTLDGLTQLFGQASVTMIEQFRDSVVNVFDDLYLKLKAPDMKQFYDQWSVKMPSIFEYLGKAINSFGTGLVAFFAPILPYAEKLAMNIKDAADSFNLWAKSKKGQKDISDWMAKAWDLSTKLWSGLKDIGSAILNIFGIGVDESGGDFATWVKNIGEDFKKWTESEQGRKDIKQWFKDAEKLAKDVKGVIKGIGEIFDTLDSPAGRTMLNLFMDFVKLIVSQGQFAAVIMNSISTAFLALQPPNLLNWVKGWDWSAIGTGIKDGLLNQFPWLRTLLDLEGGSLGDAILRGIKRILRIASPSQAMVDLMVNVGAGLLQGLAAIPGLVIAKAMEIGSTIATNIGIGLNTVVTTVAALPGRVLAVLSGLGAQLGVWATSAWTTARTSFGTGVSTTVTFFTGVPGRIITAVTALGGRFSTWASGAWQSARTSFNTGVSSAVTFFTGVPGRIIGAVTPLTSRFTTWASTSWASARTSFNTGVSTAITFFTGVPGRIITALSPSGGRLSTWATNAWGRAKTSFNAGVNSTVTTFTGVPGRIISAISSLAGRFTTWATGAWRSASSGFSAGINSLIGLVALVPGRILGALSNMGSLLLQSGRDVVNGFMNGMNEKINGVVNAAGGLASRVAAEVRSRLESRSPSKVFIRIGGDTAEGFKIGIEKSMKKVSSAASSSFGSFIAKAGSAASTNKETAVQTYNRVLRSALGEQEAAWKAQLTAVTRLSNAKKKNNIANEGMRKDLDGIKKVGANAGTDKTIPFVETWYEKRQKAMTVQDKQMLALVEEYEKRKLLTEQKIAAVKDVQAHRNLVGLGVTKAESYRSLPEPAQGGVTKNVNVAITNNNPVAEKSSSSAVRNITNIAQLVN